VATRKQGIGRWLCLTAVILLSSASSARQQAPFRVAVLLNTTRRVPPDDMARVIARADDLLAERTGQRMLQTALVDVGRGDVVPAVRDYLSANQADPPDGVLIFSDDPEAREYGGYSISVPLPGNRRSAYPSPVEGDRQAYVAVIDFEHLYAKCGYDRRLRRVSSRSRGGECRGTPGLVCVDNGRYWMCPDSTDDLHADRDHFIGCAIVHEFLHPFGQLGDDDHYGTAQCRARTGMSDADATDRRLSQLSCGICPDLFQKFRPASAAQ
jgi:hypothetical protein